MMYVTKSRTALNCSIHIKTQYMVKNALDDSLSMDISSSSFILSLCECEETQMSCVLSSENNPPTSNNTK